MKGRYMPSERGLNSGILVMRLGIAAVLLIHAVPRLIGGTRAWTMAGKEIRFLQGDVPSHIVGLILLAVEALAGLGMLSGYLFRTSAALTAGIYIMHFLNYYGIGYRTLMWYAAALACVCLGLLLSGPGRFAVSVKIESKYS
jgi:putative oxidoreductase